MDITIKIMRGIAVSNLIVFGLAACSSSPAPWVQADDSPWVTKHLAEAKSVPSDEVVIDTSLNDPVLLADPEPELIIDPAPASSIIMHEPDMAPPPEVIAPVVIEELTPEEEIMALPGSHYAVQVYAGNKVSSVDKYKASKELTNLKMVKTSRAGSIVYVLVDLHSDRSSANAAATELESRTGAKPWIRSVAGLQKIVAP